MQKGLRNIRIAVSVVCVALLTFAIIDTSFSLTRLGTIILDSQLVPAIIIGAAMWIVFWVLVTISFGRVYCSTVCPMGTMQDISAHIGVKCRKGEKKKYHYAPAINALRFPIPAIVAVCLFIGLTVVVEHTDPTYIYSRVVLGIAKPIAISLGSLIGAYIITIIILIIAWRHGRLVCNTVCPIGGLLALLSRTPVYRIDINTDKCIHCRKCEHVCKSQCINMDTCIVDNSRCVMCFNCISVCPNEAIALRRGRYRLSTPLMQPTCAMHAKNENLTT